MLNEWCVGHVISRHRFFFGRWPFDADLFSLAFDSSAMMANEVFSSREYASQTREKYAEKAATYEARL